MLNNKSFKEAYKSIFHNVKEHISHEKFILYLKHALIYFISDLSCLHILHVHKLARLPQVFAFWFAFKSMEQLNHETSINAVIIRKFVQKISY